MHLTADNIIIYQACMACVFRCMFYFFMSALYFIVLLLFGVTDANKQPLRNLSLEFWGQTMLAPMAQPVY